MRPLPLIVEKVEKMGVADRHPKQAKQGTGLPLRAALACLSIVSCSVFVYSPACVHCISVTCDS